MSKFPAILVAAAVLGLGACRTVETGAPAAAPAEAAAPEVADPPDGDMETVFSQAEAAGNTAAAADLYCAAARQGHGRSQFRLGQIYGGEADGRKKDAAGDGASTRRDLAAAMMWLDMAIINKVAEARDLRARLGLAARPDDFRLYADYTRMGAEAPCRWNEIYGPAVVSPKVTKPEDWKWAPGKSL